MNSDRLPASPTEFGLIAWLEKTRLALPLKGVECRFNVTGAVAGIELDQIYYQNAKRPLDCTYTFPLPAGGAVYRCELHVNGRVIRAKVEEEEAARQIYREQKAAGRRAALVEMERENLFTLSLGNVQPEDMIIVRFAWFQELDRTGETLRLLVPTCPGVRYIPGKPLLRTPSGRGVIDDTDQVPDASRITPPRIDVMHPDVAYFSIEGRLAASDVECGTVSSPSHPIYVREEGDSVMVALADRSSVPDQDFVLCWREPKAFELGSRAWHWRQGDGIYALVQLRAPEEVQVAEELTQDFYFLVDRSGSMSGAKWQRTCEALRAFVGLLGSRDRVWITLFESEFRDFAEAPLPAAEVLNDRGFQRMEALGANGGTELLPAAKHVLEQLRRHSAGRRTAVVLITDGQVGNEAEILNAFRSANASTVHTFGIDTAVNDAFLKSLAREHRGGCWLQTPNDDIAGTIASLADRLRRPVLTDVSVHGSWEIAGIKCPDIHAREVVLLALRGAAEHPIKICGRLPDGTEHRIALAPIPVGSEAIGLLWARERITVLLGTGQESEAITLAKKHNLVCKGTAFIAWDDAERVQVATEAIVQPSMAPVRHMAPPRRAQDRILFSLGCDSFEMRRSAKHANSPATTEDRINSARKSLTALSVPQSKIEALIASISAASKESSTGIERVMALIPGRDRDSTRFLRANGLAGAAEAVQKFKPEFECPRLRQAVKRAFQETLNGSLDDLPEWSGSLEELHHDALAWWAQLSEVGIPEPLIDHLFAWVLESSAIDKQRLSKIEHFVKSLCRLPISATSAENHWRAFLCETIGADAVAANLT